MALLTLTSDIVTIVTDLLEPGVGFNKRANWNSQDIMNRSSPVVAYSSSGPLTFSFSFQIFAHDAGSRQEVEKACDAVKGLVYPIDPGIMPPPVCYLTYPAGRFDNWMCVAESVDVRYPSDLWQDNAHSFHATIGISLLEVDLKNTPASKFAGVINNLTSNYKGGSA